MVFRNIEGRKLAGNLRGVTDEVYFRICYKYISKDAFTPIPSGLQILPYLFRIREGIVFKTWIF
jgi:hypothetical protein